MRIENTSLTDLDLGANGSSDIFYIGHLALFTAQMVVTGTAPTGTFKVQVSCDPGNPSATTKAKQTTGVANFSDFASATAAISATGTYNINVVDSGACWAKIVYTRTSGTGTAVIRINGKGV